MVDMTGLSTPQFAAIALTFFLAGLVKGVTGMGLPTVAMGLLGAIMPPAAAAALLVVPSFVTNIWQLFAGPGFAAIAARLWPMMAGILAGTIAASGMIAGSHAAWTTMALGAALAAYAAMGLFSWHWRVPVQAERRLSPFIGVTTGLVTGGTGVFVIPAVPYIQALGFLRGDLIQALGLSFTVSTIALAIGLASHGAFQGGDAGASALAVLPALLGMQAGQRLRQRISPGAFRRWFLICLLLLGAELLLRPLL
jgi:uncharacterized membrane protein YfcA